MPHVVVEFSANLRARADVRRDCVIADGHRGNAFVHVIEVREIDPELSWKRNNVHDHVSARDACRERP